MSDEDDSVGASNSSTTTKSFSGSSTVPRLQHQQQQFTPHSVSSPQQSQNKKQPADVKMKWVHSLYGVPTVDFSSICHYRPPTNLWEVILSLVSVYLSTEGGGFPCERTWTCSNLRTPLLHPHGDLHPDLRLKGLLVYILFSADMCDIGWIGFIVHVNEGQLLSTY